MTPGTTGARRTRLFQAAAVAALTAIIVASAYLGMRSQAPHSPTEKLRIALPVLPYFALVHVAVANKYFVDEGLDVSIQPATHGVAAIGYVLDGSADLAVTAEVPFVIAVMKGEDLGMLATVANATNDNSIIARKDRAIANVADLAGRKVGVSFGSGGSYFLWACLLGAKIAPESIELVNVPPNRMVEVIANGSVDAVATWVPISLEARAALGTNAVSFTDLYASGTTVGMIGRSEFLKGHVKTVEKVARALLRAEQFVRSHPEEALILVAKWMQIDIETLRPLWKNFDFRINLRQTQLTEMEGQARWAMARGYVATRPVPNFLPNLYLDALLAVAPERVTVIRLGR